MPNNAAKSEPMTAVVNAVEHELIAFETREDAIAKAGEHIQAYADVQTAELQQQCDMLAEALARYVDSLDPDMGWCPAGPTMRDVDTKAKAALASYKAKKE